MEQLIICSVKIKLDSLPNTVSKINAAKIKDPNIKYKILNISEKNIGDYVYGFEKLKVIINQTLNAKDIKELDKFDSIKTDIFEQHVTLLYYKRHHKQSY